MRVSTVEDKTVLWRASAVVFRVAWSGLCFKDFGGVTPLQGELAAAMFFSGEDLEFLLSTIAFVYLDLGWSAKVTQLFFIGNMACCRFGPACGLSVLWWVLGMLPCSLLSLSDKPSFGLCVWLEGVCLTSLWMGNVLYEFVGWLDSMSTSYDVLIVTL